MYSKETQNNLQVLIANNKTDKALEDLQSILSDYPDENQDVLVLRGKWNRGKRDYNIGLIDSREWSMIQNQVNYALLELIKNLGSIDQLKQSTENIINKSAEFAKNVNYPPDSNLDRKESSVLHKILYISSAPRETPSLRFGTEIREIRTALNDQLNLGAIEFYQELAVQPDDVLRLLKRYQPTILHIAMHNDKKEGLIFQDALGNEYPVSGEVFASFIELINARERVIQCVILNACNSRNHASALARYVRCAIGMKDFMPDDGSIAYSKGFYQYLNANESFEAAHKAGIIQLRVLAEQLVTKETTPLPEIPVIFSVIDQNIV